MFRALARAVAALTCFVNTPVGISIGWPAVIVCYGSDVIALFRRAGLQPAYTPAQGRRPPKAPSTYG